MRSRLVNVMQAFPGLTPAAIWDLPFVEWVLIAVHTDRWADAQRDQQARIDQAGRG